MKPQFKFPTWIELCKKEANKSGYCLEHENKFKIKALGGLRKTR